MGRERIPGLVALAGLLASGPARAQNDVYYRGKVTLEDGSVPDRPVTVQRVCCGLPQPIREGMASRKTGEYVVRLYVSHLGQVYAGGDSFGLLPCGLEAAATGYVSSRLDLTDRRVTLSPRLPDLVLTPKSQSANVDMYPATGVPRGAARNWELAVKRLTSRDWDGAEAPLRAVVQTAPKFAPAWAALGNVCSRQGKTEEARRALERAVELDPKPPGPLQMLAQAQLDLKDWPAVAATTERLIAADSKHIYLEAYLYSAAALYQLRDHEKALARVNEAARLDRLGELKRVEYLRGLIMEAKGDYAAAEKSLRSYLTANPRAKEAASVAERLANLGKGPPADLSSELSSLDLSLAATGETPVPGGIKALAAMARLPGTPSPHDFFLEYSRAIAAGRPDRPNRTRETRDEVTNYIATVAGLERLGERNEHGTLIRLATSNEVEVRKTRALLAELGWKLAVKGEGYALESSGLRIDRFRQRALAGLGVEELDLRRALQERREFTFEIPRETARLVGGAAWSVLLKGVPEAAGGPTEIFLRDWRFARVYRGLGELDGDTAAALVSAVGLPNLIVKYSALTADYASAVEIDGTKVVVPGGAAAESVWAKLAGASPQTVMPFLRALFEKDQGRLLAFYHALARADAAHQRFFTQTVERAEAFYKWYRDTAPPAGSIEAVDCWHRKILQSLRIDASGRIVFPGGREAWGRASETDEEILLRRAPLEALASIAVMEQQRGAPLSRPAAELLARHFNEWRSLFGYFEKLPGLDEPAFRALEEFAAEAAGAAPKQRNALLGDWHSLVQLTVMGSQAGSLSAGAAEEAFRRACAAVRGANPSPAAVTALRAMAGGEAALDEAVAGRLLRLSGPRRGAFEMIRRLQEVPRLGKVEAEPDEARTLEALSGIVYAAMLDPAYLLVAEDRQLLRKHRFAAGEGELFLESVLSVSNGSAGSHFEGGFATFAEAVQPLRAKMTGTGPPVAEQAPSPDLPSVALPATAEMGFAPGSDVVFQARGRMVEVYATVTDNRGRYVDNLNARQFSILEEGEAKPVFAFESYLAGVSVALVFDTTGSMEPILPSLKGAALQLLDDLRAVDTAAVYTFDDTVTELVPFTTDKDAAKRAILKVHASGVTALYEALVRVNHDLASRAGKKVIVVFTDGADNASMVSSQLAIESAKERGIPIYTIAQGEAVVHPELVGELRRISQATGGTPFLIRNLNDIAEVFEKISQDLLHGYLVAFQPTPSETRAWRKIEVVLSGPKGLQVRAREGYYVE